MATRQAPSISEGVTVIGSGIQVNGRVSGAEDLHVEGRLEGSVVLTETFHVASNGIVMAEVKARDVVVSGILVGNVTAEDSVTLNPGAKLIGDIAAPRLIIADGAVFSGNIGMGGEAPPRRERKKATAARARPAARPRTAASPARAEQPSSSSSSSSAARTAPPRVAAIPVPTAAIHDDEVTVVVRHAAVDASGKAERDAAAPKPGARRGAKAKKSPPRARVPKPGKRRVGRG